MSETQPLHTTASPEATSTNLWPEAIRNYELPPDPFPWRLFARWFVPGLVGAILLAGLFFYFNSHARRQIVYLTQEGGLAVIRANGTGQRMLLLPGLERARFGAPRWSPNGATFVTIAEQPDPQLLVVEPSGGSSRAVDVDGSASLTLVEQSWSADGAHVAARTRSQDGKDALVVVDVAQMNARIVDLGLQRASRPRWHPRTADMLVTSLSQGITPTLELVNSAGAHSSFTPGDGQIVHQDAVWSPDGTHVVYVAGTDPSLNKGNIWIANSDGSSPQVLVAEGLNMAPVWAPQGDLLFFTRFLTPTSEYELYKVNPVTKQVALVGPGSSAVEEADTPLRHLLAWSPDYSKMFFLGEKQGSAALYLASYDGANAQSIRPLTNSFSQARLIQWAPTGRALLIAGQEREFFLLWVDQERSVTSFVSGVAPAWQP